MELGPGGLYVHVADDGGIFVTGGDQHRSSWITLPELRARVTEVAERGGEVALSTERGSTIGAPAAQAVADGAHWTQVEPLPETQRQGGVTTLISAAGVGAVALVDDLIERGADLEQREDLGRTAAMVAASKGEEEALRRLASAGAALDPVDRQGRTALWLAAAFGRASTVRALLALGVDAETRDEDGRSPRDAAHTEGHPEVVDLLPAPASRPTGDRGARTARPRNPLRGRTVLVDRPGELVVRTFDPLAFRVIGIGGLVLCAAIGAAVGSLSGFIAGIVVLVFSFGFGQLAARRAVKVVGGAELRARQLGGWGRPVHLDRVVSAHHIPHLRSGPALQLLGDEVGTHHPSGVGRWQGVEPRPTAADGSRLRCLLVPLGVEADRVLAEVAPVLLDHAILDDATRAALAGRGR